MQKHVNLVDLVKSFPANIFLQNLALVQQITRLIKIDHLEFQNWMKNRGKVRYRTFQLSRVLLLHGRELIVGECKLAPQLIEKIGLAEQWRGNLVLIAPVDP